MALGSTQPLVKMSIARLKPDGTLWHTGGELKGKLAYGVGSQYSHTTSERGVSSITTADAHTSAASSRLNWLPRRFKWTRPFRRKTKSGFCACAIRFQTSSTRNIPGGKGGRCVTLTTSPLSRAECHEIWEPKPPGTLWATPGLLRDSFTLQFLRVPAGWGSQFSRQSAQEGGKFVSPRHRPPLPPRKYSWYSFLLESGSTPGP